MPAMLCFALGKAPRDNMARESFDSTTRLLSRTPSFSSSNIAIVPTIAMANNGQYGTSLPPVLEPQTEYITTSSREQMVIIVGREDSPNTLRKFHVSRPHVECMGAHWNAAIERNTRIRFRDVRVTKEILFPDDDSNAIRLCLYIAHLSFAKLPKYLSLDDLVNLARVAERYDLNHLIPFAHLENWMAPHSKRLLQPGYEPWLYVAWQFGLEEDFRQLATHLAVTCKVDDRGELLSPTGRRFTEEDYPADVLYTIKVARTARLANLFKITYRLITEMAAADICKHNHSPDSGTPSSYICTAHNNLGLQRYLSLHAFEYPKIKNAAEIRQSVNDITNILTSTVGIGRCMRTIGVKTLESIQEPPEGPEMGFRHDECRIEYELAERIHHAARSAPWAVTVETMDEMRGNAARMNVYQDKEFPVEWFTAAQ